MKINNLFYIQNQSFKMSFLLCLTDFTLYDYAHSAVLRSHRAKTGRLKKGEANAFHAQGYFDVLQLQSCTCIYLFFICGVILLLCDVILLLCRIILLLCIF